MRISIRREINGKKVEWKQIWNSYINLTSTHTHRYVFTSTSLLLLWVGGWVCVFWLPACKELLIYP